MDLLKTAHHALHMLTSHPGPPVATLTHAHSHTHRRAHAWWPARPPPQENSSNAGDERQKTSRQRAGDQRLPDDCSGGGGVPAWRLLVSRPPALACACQLFHPFASAQIRVCVKLELHTVGLEAGRHGHTKESRSVQAPPAWREERQRARATLATYLDREEMTAPPLVLLPAGSDFAAGVQNETAVPILWCGAVMFDNTRRQPQPANPHQRTPLSTEVT